MMPSWSFSQMSFSSYPQIHLKLWSWMMVALRDCGVSEVKTVEGLGQCWRKRWECGHSHWFPTFSLFSRTSSWHRKGPAGRLQCGGSRLSSPVPLSLVSTNIWECFPELHGRRTALGLFIQHSRYEKLTIEKISALLVLTLSLYVFSKFDRFQFFWLFCISFHASFYSKGFYSEPWTTYLLSNVMYLG